MVSFTRADTVNCTWTLRTKCSYTYVTVVVKRRISIYGMISDRAIKFTWGRICVSVCSAVVTLEISTRFVTSARKNIRSHA